MKIAQISVKDLFGLYNHKIILNEKENITIIHAPNGYGKTTILNMISAIFSGYDFYLRKIPFSEFLIVFDNECQLRIIKIEEESDEKHEWEEFPNIRIQYHFIDTKNKISEEYRPFQSFRHNKGYIHKIRKMPLHLIDEYIPHLNRVGRLRWHDERGNELLNLDNVLSKYSSILPSNIFNTKKIPKWLEKIRENFSIHFIRSQRLIRIGKTLLEYETIQEEAKKRDTSSVILYSKEIQDRIEAKLAESAALSQSFDRTFPTRLINEFKTRKTDIMTKQQIETELENLENKRSKLEAVGLLDKKGPVTIPKIEAEDKDTRRVLSIYIRDTNKKLEVFDEMEKTINLMKEIINTKFINKRLEISREHGFVFHLPNGTLLKPDSLSSGEQNEIAMMYELLFKAKPGSIILIDEPEISLHVYWQKQFLNDLIQISKISKISIIIATHSPQIIHNRWDLAVELKGEKQ